jgi:hypothetical protein
VLSASVWGFLGGGLPVWGYREVGSIPEELLQGQGRILFFLILCNYRKEGKGNLGSREDAEDIIIHIAINYNHLRRSI